MAAIDELRQLEYRVEQAQEVEGVTIWYVDGYGMQTYVRDDDPEAFQNLVDSHDERAQQQDETTEQSQLRWHEDPENAFELSDERVDELREIVKQQEEQS
jgi:hypothetical protein